MSYPQSIIGAVFGPRRLGMDAEDNREFRRIGGAEVGRGGAASGRVQDTSVREWFAIGREHPHHAFLIELWAPGCAPCVAAHPQLEAIAKQYAGQLIVLRVLNAATPTESQILPADAVLPTFRFYGPHLEGATSRFSSQLEGLPPGNGLAQWVATQLAQVQAAGFEVGRPPGGEALAGWKRRHAGDAARAAEDAKHDGDVFAYWRKQKQRLGLTTPEAYDTSAAAARLAQLRAQLQAEQAPVYAQPAPVVYTEPAAYYMQPQPTFFPYPQQPYVQFADPRAAYPPAMQPGMYPAPMQSMYPQRPMPRYGAYPSVRPQTQARPQPRFSPRMGPATSTFQPATNTTPMARVRGLHNTTSGSVGGRSTDDSSQGVFPAVGARERAYPPRFTFADWPGAEPLQDWQTSSMPARHALGRSRAFMQFPENVHSRIQTDWYPPR